MSEQPPEFDEDTDIVSAPASALGAAIVAAFTALLALLLALLTLLVRAIQALLVLARPGLCAGSAVLAGYGAIRLFPTVLARYGGDMPAIVLALTSIVIVPATLLVLAGDYGIWAALLLSGVLSLLAHLALERAPPFLLALFPVLALSACILYLSSLSQKGASHEKTE